MQKIITVCIGNVCRSPIAEGLLKHHLTEKNPQFEIASAGLSALVDNPAERFSQQVMEANGMDISTHRAQQLTPELIQQHDLILVMDNEQKKQIEFHSPQARGKIYLVGAWGSATGENTGAFEVPDPYRQSYAIFENIYCLIEQGVLAWTQKLL